MNLDTTRVPENSIGSLDSWLIEGNPLQQRRARTIRRRAIFFSLVFQTVAVAALLIFPLLGKGERIPVKMFIEHPPYSFGTQHPNTGAKQNMNHRTSGPCYICRAPLTPGRPTLRESSYTNDTTDDAPFIPGAPEGDPNGALNGIKPASSIPARPTTDHPVVEQHHRIVLTHIDPARITRRIEPVYPVLGIQLRHETRVELRAIISTDGSIQSLQVISGDPLFYQSAIEAVSQWRYTPTLLNDQPVEVDTHITVIYSLNR